MLFFMGLVEAQIWPVKSVGLVWAKWASPDLKLASPGRRRCEFDRPEVVCISGSTQWAQNIV